MSRKTIRLGALILGISFSLSTGLLMAAPVVSFKIGSLVPVNSLWGRIIMGAVRSISQRTGGQVSIQFFHSGQLGGETDMLNQMLIGSLDGAGLTSAALSSLEKGFMVVESPFLFANYNEATHVIDRAIYPELKKRLAAKKLMTIDFMMNGFFQMITPGPLKRSSDLSRMKIGSWESPVQVAYWKNLGARPKAIPVTEVPSAYATGLVNAGANGISAAAAYDFVLGSAVRRSNIFITRTNHLFQAGVLVFSQNSFNRVPKGAQKIMLEELKKMAFTIRREVPKDEAAAVQKLTRLKYNLVNPSKNLMVDLRKGAAVTNKAVAAQVGQKFYQNVLKVRADYRKKTAKKVK